MVRCKITKCCWLREFVSVAAKIVQNRKKSLLQGDLNVNPQIRKYVLDRTMPILNARRSIQRTKSRVNSLHCSMDHEMTVQAAATRNTIRSTAPS